MRRRRTVLVAALVTAASLLLGSASPVLADQYDDQRAQNQARQDAVDKALADLSAELEDTSAALVQAYAELQGIQAAIPVAQAQLQTARDELGRLQREAAVIADRLTAATTLEASIGEQITQGTAQVGQLRAGIGQMARDAYKGTMTGPAVAAVLDARSATELVQNTELAQVALRTQVHALDEIQQITGVNRNREARQVAVREQVTELKAQADANVAAAATAEQAAQQHAAELAALEKEATAKAASIEQQKQSQQAKAEELKAQQNQLEADLKEIIRQQDAARKAAGKTPIGSTANQPFTNPTNVNPIYKTSDYGMRFHPVLHYTRLHAGVDLRTYCNTPVYAGASGTVEWARYRSGYGNQVMLDNGYWNGKSLMSSYNHLSSMVVKGGQSVDQGQLVGYAGNEGTSTGCHLHFEVYVDGSTVDPWPLIAK